MAEVLPPDASVVKGGIGALGYHSDLYIHDLFGLVSPQIIPHRIRDNPTPKGPGHDVFVRPAYFLRHEPTIFRHKLISAPNVDGKVRVSVHKWRMSKAVRATYAPAIYPLGGTSTDAPEEVLLVLQRIDPAMTSAEGWKQYERQLRALTGDDDDAKAILKRCMFVEAWEHVIKPELQDSQGRPLQQGPAAARHGQPASRRGRR